MKTFKFLTFMLLALSFSFVSCSSDDDDDNGGDKEKEEIKKQIEEITSDLGKNDELSAFTEAFKALDVNAVDTKELTLFAFKDEVLESALKSSPEVSQELLKRHIAKGAYTVEQLKKVKEVLSLNGDKLAVTTDSTGTVNINGVPLGSPQKVSNSIIFLIDQMLPATPMDSTKNNITIKVIQCNENWSLSILPEEGFPAENALVKIYKSDNTLYQTLKTDKYGEVSFAWAPNLKLYYSVEKGDSKNLFEGWEITGLFTSFGELDDFTGTYPGGHNVLGGLKFKDVNGDGKIDNNDKMKGNMELPSNAAIIEVFISPEVYRKQETDSTILERIQNKFFSIDATMSTLTQRQGGSVNPENDALASFWADAYGTIMNLNQRLANEQNDDKKARLMKNRACIYSMLPVVFGDVPLAVLAADTLPARSSMADVYRLVEQDSYMAINALTLHDKTDALITIATVQMQMVSEGTQYYQQAATTCKQILDLGTLGWQAGGDNEKYVKVSLLYAEAANENGQLQEALEAVNRLYQAAGLTIPLPPSSTQEQIRSAVRTAYDNSKFAVKGTKYTNTSRWGLNSGWGKYILLPIPQKAINNSRGIITQNAGW